MSILSTYQKIQTLVAATSGITSAPSRLPEHLNDDDLPCAITTIGPGSWNSAAIGLKRLVQDYIIRVYVAPITQDMEIDAGFQRVIPIVNALGNTFMDNTSLDNTVDGINEPMTYAGIRGDLNWGGVFYHGFELTVRVTEKTT